MEVAVRYRLYRETGRPRTDEPGTGIEWHPDRYWLLTVNMKGGASALETSA